MSDKISLIRNPIKSIQILLTILIDLLLKLRKINKIQLFLFVIVNTFVISAFKIENRYTQELDEIQIIVKFCLYWILLGVASSIGLGTGLHTFVLYLGPHIAKVAMMANECNQIPDYLPNRYQFKQFGTCQNNNGQSISIFDIILNVQLESMLWGFGTALGELPPYFIARAAALANQKVEELDEINSIQKNRSKSFMDTIKLTIYKHLQKYAFLTVLICASIPNPLFDLAGITCGHFKIPFKIFFTATSIGKAIIKTHIQMIFVIVTFSKNKVEHLILNIEQYMPFLKNKLTQTFEKQKALLLSPNQIQNQDKPLIGQIWDIIITSMIIFFIYSTLESLVNNYNKEEKENKIQKQKQKQK